MVKVAGKDLLVSVPGLIGDQLFIPQDEKKREVDADLGFPRSLRNVISFTIPEGYKLVGLQNLNTNIENEAGQFAVQASIENNVLTIMEKKIYKQAQVKKENWSKLIEMLDAAYNFSQKKILLRKS
jgi:hypothetical protein